MKLKTNTLTLKNLFFALTICAFLPLTWSCGDDDDDDDKKGVEIPEGWTKNNDLELLSKKSWYLYKSGNDSIKLEFSQFQTLYDYGSLRYQSYKKKKNGSYSRDNFAYLHNAYSIERGDEKQILGNSHYQKDFSAYYKIVDNSTVIMYSLPELDIPAEGYEFKAVTRKYYTENRLKGGWYNTGVVDSMVLEFDNNILKEYKFVRTSSTVVDSWNYGKYNAKCTRSFLGNEFLVEENELKFEEFSDDDCTYSVNGDKLTIQWKEPRETTTYTRIKQ